MPKKANTGIEKKSQPVMNIGLIGHVDHGKTTLVSQLSGKWTDTHSEEMKRGITIRLGYANASFYKCSKCKGPDAYGIKEKCDKCKGKCELLRKVSFVDAPGHETLMATMLSGAAIMDAAILLVAANEKCPQPQTKEHIMALEMAGIDKIIIVQNKIDLVSEEEVKQNYKEIKDFIKGTIAEKAPIVPICAQQGINMDALIYTMEEEFPTPKRDPKKDPLMLIARSFDINKPGNEIKKLKGGVLGGSLKEGIFKVGDKIEIRPGMKVEKDNKSEWKTVSAKIIGIQSGSDSIEEASPGGSIALLTKLDPSIVKSDTLGGNVAGIVGKLPPIWNELELEAHLLNRVVGTKEEKDVESIKKWEILMLNVNASVTTGVVSSLNKGSIHVVLKRPVCARKTDRITLSRLLGHRFRLIGYGIMK